MEGIKHFVCLVVFGCMLICEAKYSTKFPKSHEDLSKETILFRDKLNLILDAESKEVNLLKNLLDEEHDKQEEEQASSKTVNKVENGKKSENDDGSVDVDIVGHGKSLEYLREHGIVTKLEENSKRMEKMVVFMVDLRNLLTEALTQQNRQMGMESELVEMREEMEYLRKELQTLKSEHHKLSAKTHENIIPEMSTSSLENKLHNEHATLEWLKTNTQELRNQISEISDQCNVTLLMSLRDKVEGDGRNREENLHQMEKQLEILRLGQMKQQEEIKEGNENIKDLRQWQSKMGTKLALGMSREENSVEEDGERETEERFITEALKDAVGKPATLRHHQNHKRLKSKVYQLQQLVNDLTTSNKNHERRLSKLETSQRTLKSLISSTSSNNHGGRSQRSISSIQNLEKSLQEYAFTLENLNLKVSGMNELQESTTQIFHSLENIEKKYDDRVGEIQTALARLESGVSGMKVVNEDLKEQQTQQASVIQSVKKDLFQVKGQLQTNHLRLAGVQSELVKLAGTKCSLENTESIQNIRIATLEHKLLDNDGHHHNSRRSNFNELTSVEEETDQEEEEENDRNTR